MRISDWSSDVCSSDLLAWQRVHDLPDFVYFDHSIHINKGVGCSSCHGRVDKMPLTWRTGSLKMQWCLACHRAPEAVLRSEEHTSELQSLMRISYAVFCLKKKK